MTSKINAITTGAGGIEVTGDSSGEIEFQANGSTIATITSSGLDVASGLTFGSPIDIASGGTGQTTATSAFNALAPSQSTHSGKFLTTDGTNTSWGAVSTDPTMGGDLSGTASNAQIVAGSVGATELSSTLDLSGKTVTLPAGTGGKVLQVLQAVKTNEFSTTSTSYVDLTNLSVSITPSSTSSKILISYNINGGTAGDVCHGYLTLVRNSTEIFKADTAGSRRSATNVINTPTQMQLTYSAEYLDSPSTTSATTYKVQILSSNGLAVYINRSGRDNNALAFDGRSVSSITVMEIAG